MLSFRPARTTIACSEQIYFTRAQKKKTNFAAARDDKFFVNGYLLPRRYRAPEIFISDSNGTRARERDS